MPSPPGTSVPKQRKTYFKNILLLVTVVAICLLLVEAMSRLIIDDGMSYELEMWKYARDVKIRDSRPDIGHRHAANRGAELMGATVRTNAFGFRGPEIAEKTPPGVARIAFVGDSTTLGWGVTEQETFAAQVIADLKRRGRKVDGFNLGVGNYNTTQELALFRDTGAKMKPDIIVLTYFINDAEPMPAYKQENWLDLNSAAWILFRYRVDSLKRQFGDLPDWKKYYRDLYKPEAAGWKETQRALGGFADVARELDAQLIVFNLPELRELRPYPFDDVTAKVRSVVESKGVTFVDMLPAVEKLDPPSLWVTVPDPHPNGRANSAFTSQMTKDILPLLDRVCSKAAKGC